LGNFNLDVTLKKALDEYQSKKPLEMAWKTGADFQGDRFKMDFMGAPVELTYPEGILSEQKGGKELGLIERILVLHYLSFAGGSPILNQKITFKELPGGSIYIEPFSNRCLRPFIAMFGDDLTSFQRAAEKCGGIKESFGDISFCFYPFPKIPVTFVLWAGDEEFPANGNIILDASAGDYLPTEDYAFLCSMLVGKLKQCK
jgi:hypothetical protein